MGLSGEGRSHCEGDVLGGSARSQPPKRSWREDSAGDAVEEPIPDEPAHEVGCGLLGEPEPLANLCGRDPATFVGGEVVQQLKDVSAHL
jgi:hypothetical protein